MAFLRSAEDESKVKNIWRFRDLAQAKCIRATEIRRQVQALRLF
jgi:hypothetical protein